MKKFITLILSLLFLQCSTSKLSELYSVYSPADYIYWSSTRQLTWDDFQGEPLSSANYASEIHIYNPSTVEKSNMFSSPKLTAICVFDKRHSWVDRSLANSTTLEYNQVIFNIYEVYTRKLRKTFSETKFGLDDFTEKYHSMTERLNSELTDEVEQFRKESELGKNDRVVNEWAEKIKSELENLKKFGENSN